MKKIMLITAVLAIAGFANAQNLLINGDMESSGGWSVWYGGNTALPTPDPLDGGNNVAGVWWNDDGFFQEIDLGISEYQVSGRLLTTSDAALGAGRIGLLKVEMGQKIGETVNIWWSEERSIDGSVVDEWVDYSWIVDNREAGEAGGNYMKVNLFMFDTAGVGSGAVRFDDISVEAIPEPATMGLLALFGGGILAIRRFIRI